MTGKTLEGVKVLEFSERVSGPYCTKLMADLGAEVIKIEPPGKGDEARAIGPFPGDVPHLEKSGLFAYLNTNKLGITLDPSTPDGQRIFKELAKDADILVEDLPLGEMDRLGLGYQDLKALNPGLIMTSITPFGQTGPFKDYKAYHLNISHVSGQGYMLPLPAPDLERPPVKAGGNTGDYDPGLVASVAVLAALFWKGVTGRGQLIDMSKQEALISMQRVESVTYANDQVVITRTGGRNRMPGGILPCKDGHVVIITPEEHQWKAFMELIGNPEWSKKDWCRDHQARAEHAEEINELLMEWTRKRTKEEIYKKGQALSCPVAPLSSAEDMVKSDQLKAREFFVDMEHPKLGKLKFPSASYRFSKSPWRLERPAPLLGQHNEEVYTGRLGYTKDDLAGLEKTGVI